MYPVNNGAKNFGCVVHESLKTVTISCADIMFWVMIAALRVFGSDVGMAYLPKFVASSFVSGYVVDRHDTGNCLLSLFRF